MPAYSPSSRGDDVRPIDVVVVKGKTRPVTIFEVFQNTSPAVRAAKRLTRALAARRYFEQCLALVLGDTAVANLLKSGA